jgi:hypothetical protein
MNPRVEEDLTRDQGKPLAGWLGRLVSRGRWLLCEVGYRLVALGAWLEGTLTAEGDPGDGPTR